jgi:DNA-binding transcriptional ArsR family regulator
MEATEAVKALSALAQEGRLTVFRLLVRAGREGMAAGDLARKLDVAANTLSAQLTILSTAGLVVSRREGRSIIYTASYDEMDALIVFLMANCCQGRSEICVPVAAAASWSPKDYEGALT